MLVPFGSKGRHWRQWIYSPVYFISNNEINFYHPVFVIQSRNNVIGAVVKIMLKVITSKLGAEVGDCEVAVNSPIVLHQLVLMYSWQLVILYVNENCTAGKVHINQINPPNIEWIFVLVSDKLIKSYLSSFECPKTWGKCLHRWGYVCCKHAYPICVVIALNVME